MIWENILHTSETDCFVQESGVLCQTRYAFVYLQHPPYTAFGKTVTAIGLIAERKINTLILVHTKALLDQWKSRLEEFLEIDFTEEDLPKKRGSALYLMLIFSVANRCYYVWETLHCGSVNFAIFRVISPVFSRLFQRFCVNLYKEYTSLKSRELEELLRFQVMSWQPS